MSGVAGFLTGLAGGAVMGLKMKQSEDADKRAKESHDTTESIKKLGLKRMEAEQAVLDKELNVRGLKADYQATEQGFLGNMQEFEQGTRKLLAEGTRTQAQTAVAAGQATAERQPDEIALAREDLNKKIADSVQQQTANLWNVYKLGNSGLALDMLNKSKLIMPGEKFKGISLEDVETKGPDGQPTTAKMLTLEPEGEGGKKRQIPVAQLEALSQRYGAQYKVVGGNLVRIDSQGNAKPIYETDQFAANPETGGVFSKKTGLPAAAGVGGGPGGASGKATVRVDNRVKMAIDKVILPKYGGRFEGGLFFPDKKNKDVAQRATVLTEQFIRGGQDPIAAADKAISQAEREKALAAGGAGTPAAGGYTGPTPWKK